MSEDPDSTGLQVAVRIEDPRWLAAIPGAEALCRRAAASTAASRVPVRQAPARRGPIPRAPIPQADVTLVLGDDALLRRLNRDFRGKDRPTNVLAFPLDAIGEPLAPGLPRLLGDVVLARETLLREADEQGKAAADHLQHLVVHGLLHLLGFDHEAEPEAQAMEAAEIAILAGLGVADPYRPAGTHDAAIPAGSGRS